MTHTSNWRWAAEDAAQAHASREFLEGELQEVTEAVLEVVTQALSTFYHTQNPSNVHPADFITKVFRLPGHEGLMLPTPPQPLPEPDDTYRDLMSRLTPERAEIMYELAKALSDRGKHQRVAQLICNVAASDKIFYLNDNYLLHELKRYNERREP